MVRLRIVTAVAAFCAIVFLSNHSRADDLHDALESVLSSDAATAKFLSITRDHKEPADQAKISHWLKEKVDNGQAPDQFASFMIVVSLVDKNFDDALMYLSYYRALLVIDGATCPDTGGPSAVFEGTIFVFGRLLNVSKFTDDQKRDAVARALKLEEATSSARKKDPSLCNPKDPNIPPERQSGPSKSSGLYIDDPTWRQKRATALSNLKGLLLASLGMPNKP